MISPTSRRQIGHKKTGTSAAFGLMGSRGAAHKEATDLILGATERKSHPKPLFLLDLSKQPANHLADVQPCTHLWYGLPAKAVAAMVCRKAKWTRQVSFSKGRPAYGFPRWVSYQTGYSTTGTEGGVSGIGNCVSATLFVYNLLFNME